MKALSIGKKYNKGFATLEILIAFAIIILAISSIVFVAFGNQSIAVDSQLSNESIAKAKKGLEDARANAKFDFNLVNPSTTTENSGGVVYTKKIDVTQTDLYTKQVISTVTWQTAGQILSTILTTLLTNPSAVNGGSTCSSVLSGDWKNPKMIPANGWDLSQVGVNTNSGNGFELSDIIVDSRLNPSYSRLYITANKIPNSYHDGFTFFIFDLSNPLLPSYVGGGDNIDLSAVAINGNYAYAAAANSPQLRVIDISTPSNPKFKVAVNVTGVTGTQAAGNSIFYSNGYVYLGLTAAGSNKGPEFHIFNVQNPLAPVEVGSWPASNIDFNNDINSILVRGNYAYLAHPQDSIYGEQLTVLDISNPSNPVRKSGFYGNASSVSVGNGKSLSLVGNNLYFGRTATKLSGTNDAVPELYILNIADPTSIPPTPQGVVPLPTSGDSINNLSVRDYLAFLITNKQFQVWDLSDKNNIKPWTSSGTSANFLSLPSGKGTAVDCTNNYFYVISESSQGNVKDLLSIITPGP